MFIVEIVLSFQHNCCYHHIGLWLKLRHYFPEFIQTTWQSE